MKRKTPLLATLFVGCALIVPAAASATPYPRPASPPSVKADLRQANRALDALERKLNRICPHGCKGARRNLATIRSSLRDIKYKVHEARRVDHVRRYSYKELRRKMRHARTDRERLAVISYASHLPLTMHQTCELLVTFHGRQNRLEALRIVRPWIVDPHNVRVLDEAFDRRSDRRRAQRIVWNWSAPTDAYAFGRGQRAR